MTTAGLQDRVVLLSQAIDLCQSLAALLRMLGPKHSTDVLQQDEPSSRQLQIRSMEGALDEEFRAAMEARNQVLAPVYRLTDDALRLCFLHLQTDDSPESSRPFGFSWWSKEMSDLSYGVSFVCRRWRNVALGTAPLWSQVSLRAPTDLPLLESERNHPRFRNRQSVIGRRHQLSLDRSREALMSVDINIFGPTSIPTLLQYFSIGACASRVKALAINISDFPHPISLSTALWIYQQCVQANAAKLMNLTFGRLRDRGTADEAYEEILASLLSIELPRLQQANFDVMPFPSQPQFAILASCRVLSMHCSPRQNFSRECCERLFTTCGQLEDIRLVMELYDASIDSGASSTRICMPRMHSFKVSYQRCALVAFPFPLLSLPNLHALHISRTPPAVFPEELDLQVLSGPDNLTLALSVMLQSSPSIHSFSIDNVQPDLLRQIMPRISTVRNLSLVYSKGFGDHDSATIRERYREVLTSLVHIQDISTSLPLPHLESLYLGSPATMTNLLALQDFLEQRKAANIPIRSLRLRDFLDDYGLATTGISAPLPSLDEAYATEGKVADLVESFSITKGSWYFDKKRRAWKKGEIWLENSETLEPFLE